MILVKFNEQKKTKKDQKNGRSSRTRTSIPGIAKWKTENQIVKKEPKTVETQANPSQAKQTF